MAFRNRLLSTAAIPLLVLTGMEPVSAAALVRPPVAIEASSDIVLAQAEEELQNQRKERREQRQERREERREQRQEQKQEQRQERRNQVQGQDDGAAEPRRNRQRQAAEEQIQQDVEQPRRKRQDSAEEAEQPRNNRRERQQAEEQQQNQQRRERRNEADKGQPSDEELRKALEENNENRRNRRNRDNAAEEQQENRRERQKADEQQNQQRQERRKQADQGEPSDEELRKAVEENNQKRNQRKRDQAGDERPADAERADTPERIERRKKIAEDPSKTTDTVVLPVEKGAAVLDSDKDADKSGDRAARERRKRQREEAKPAAVPKSDREAQAGFRERTRLRPALSERGERISDFKGYDRGPGRQVRGRKGDDVKVIIDLDGRIVVRDDDRRRVRRDGEIRYERLGDNRIREVVVRPNGDRIVTVRNRYGEIIRRSRIDRNDREVVIFYTPELERGRDRLFLRDPGLELPPMRLTIPVSEYIIDVSGSRNRNYREFLELPPVEPVERVYSVDEVKYSARIRDKMRRIDLDTITFETGSAEIDMDQAETLRDVASSMQELLDRDPGETFLIEGHTDAVGSDESNLILSDDRAEAVADLLTDAFGIPAENLVTQGYGERYLKIDTDGPERANRRVTIRRITPLVRPVAEVEQ